jgi:hypothetical protein
MALIHLDGPAEQERLPLQAMRLPPNNFDFGNGISVEDFVRSPYNKLQNATLEQNLSKAHLPLPLDYEGLRSHIMGNISRPGNIDIGRIDEAIAHMRSHLGVAKNVAPHEADIKNGIAALQSLKSHLAAVPAIGYAGDPPPAGYTYNLPGGGGIWIVPDATNTVRGFTQAFVSTPMGDYTTDDSGGVDPLTKIANLIQGGINQWLTSSGFAGSGNTQTAEDALKEGLNTTDGQERIVAYQNFFNTITSDPRYKAGWKDPKSNFFAKVGAAISTAAKAVAHVATQVVKAVVTVAKDVEHVVAMVAAAPVRLAALALIRSNDMSLATSLAAAWQKDSNKVKGFWSALGGNPNDLKSAIITGSGVSIAGGAWQGINHNYGTVHSYYRNEDGRNVKVSNHRRRVNGEGIGETAAAEIAVPIVNAIMTLLRAMGIPIPVAVQAKIDAWINKATAKVAEIAKDAGNVVALLAPPGSISGFVSPNKLVKPFPVVPVIIGGSLIAILIGLSVMND